MCKPHFENLWVSLGINAFLELTIIDIPFCPRVLHCALCFWCTKMNVFLFLQGPIFVTLRDVVSLTSFPTDGEDVISKKKKIFDLLDPTLNNTPSFYTILFDDISNSKNLSLEEEHKYFYGASSVNLYSGVSVPSLLQTCVL